MLLIMEVMMKNKLYKIFLLLLPYLIIKFDVLLLYLYNANFCKTNFLEIESIWNFYCPESCIIVYSIFLFMVYINKSYRKSNIILLISSYIFIIINGIKIFYMQEPIYISDIKLLNGIGDVLYMTSNTSSNFITSNYHILLFHTLVIALCLFVLIKFKYKDVERKNGTDKRRFNSAFIHSIYETKRK